MSAPFPTDRAQAERFLTALHGGPIDRVRFFFRTFDDSKQGRKDLALNVHGTLAEAWPRLLIKSQAGAGVFVTVNASTGTLKADVTTARAVWRDVDGGAAPAAPIEPHMVVRTANGHHDYWLASTDDFDAWDGAMHTLVAQFGGDANAKDRGRVLRLPGFLHQKNPAAPFMVTVEVTGAAPYTWAQIIDAFPPVEKAAKAPSSEGAPSSEDDAELTRRIISGDNYNGSLVTLSARYAARGMTESAIYETLAGLLNGNGDDSDRAKARRAELRNTARSALKKFAPENTGRAAAAVGEFEVVAVANGAVALPELERRKSGRIVASRNNLTAALARPDLTGVRLQFDEFSGTRRIAFRGADKWDEFDAKAHLSMIATTLEFGATGFEHIAESTLAGVVEAMFKTTVRIDSAREWVSSLRWDGVPRVERFLTTYLGAEDSEYTRAVGRYVWTALAGRALEAGVKADMVLVLVGPQGSGKSTVVAKMAPPDRSGVLGLDEKEDDIRRKMQGKLVMEMGELKGMGRKELAELKAFITLAADEWVQKYANVAQTRPRRCLFVGTTNAEQFLPDDDEHRRWLPVKVPGRGPAEYIAAGKQLDADRDQMWAEGAELFIFGGVDFAEAQELARARHAEFEMPDAWAERVEQWLADKGIGDTPRQDTPFSTGDVVAGAVGKRLDATTRADLLRMAAILKRLGFAQSGRAGRGGARLWAKGGAA